MLCRVQELGTKRSEVFNYEFRGFCLSKGCFNPTIPKTLKAPLRLVFADNEGGVATVKVTVPEAKETFFKAICVGKYYVLQVRT